MSELSEGERKGRILALEILSSWTANCRVGYNSQGCIKKRGWGGLLLLICYSANNMVLLVPQLVMMVGYSNTVCFFVRVTTRSSRLEKDIYTL